MMDNSNRIDELQTALTTAIRINEFLMAENELLKDKDFTSCSEKLPEEDDCYLVVDADTEVCLRSYNGY